MIIIMVRMNLDLIFVDLVTIRKMDYIIPTMLMRIFGDMTQKQGSKTLMLLSMEGLQVNLCS